MGAAEAAASVVERLKASLEAAADYNPGDAAAPAAVLWADSGAQWRPILPRLLPLMPQLLVYDGERYAPEERAGPAVWLRCAAAGVLDSPAIPAETTPVLYLPGVDRRDLSAAGECPQALKPLVELQYRGVCWTQKNGRDWTVEAFLTSRDGGLGLDIARDAATRRSMLRALAELAQTPAARLRGRRLDGEDFDRLLSGDPVRDALIWLNDPPAAEAQWSSARWSAFVSRCEAEYAFHPEKDGAGMAAELLGRREGAWAAAWERFAEAPRSYPGLPEKLRRAKPRDLFAEQSSSWPQNNERGEEALRQAFLELAGKTPQAARKRLAALEKEHGERRGWVWAKLDRAPLAGALEHLAEIAALAANELGGASADDMAKLYAERAWRVDAAALAGMAAVRSAADAKAVSAALDAAYRPWLETAALRLQGFVQETPLPGRGGEGRAAAGSAPPGVMFLFADGLRFDVAQRLAERLRERGRTASVAHRWAALPTVTATAKPAVSPAAERIEGGAVGEDFRPLTADERQPLTPDRFRKLLAAAGCAYVRKDETGGPNGSAWTEHGELDKLGHQRQEKLASHIDEQIGLLLERIEALLGAGRRAIRVVTDHGWLWLPGGLPKVDLPQYLTETRWARCASIKGASTVGAPTAAWHWNAGETVALAPDISCFEKGYAYAHGGVSLQECLIPVIEVGAGASAEEAVVIADVSWVGLRCRVKLDAPRPGLSAALRRRAADADSGIGAAQPVNEEGRASLLVADDELEGSGAFVVILDAQGNAAARQATTIGG